LVRWFSDEKNDFRAIRVTLRDCVQYVHRVRTSPTLHGEHQPDENPVLAFLANQLQHLILHKYVRLPGNLLAMRVGEPGAIGCLFVCLLVVTKCSGSWQQVEATLFLIYCLDEEGTSSS